MSRNLSQILAISGRPGLYRYVAKARNGLVVEKLENQQRFSITMTASVSTLGDISIYTERGETPLAEVFTSMLPHVSAIRALNIRKDEAQVRTLFGEVLPDYLRDRVRVSDMQKAFRWFLELLDAGFEEFVREESTAEGEAEEEAPEGASNV